MIKISERRLLTDLPFADYLKIPAYSHSGLKGVVITTPTPGMLLGTRVDNFLFEPHLYDGVDYKIVRSCAEVLKGIMTPGARPRTQLAVTCNMEFEGKVMPVKGRLDMFLPGLVIDLKISKMPNLAQTINHFGYHHQISGYAMMTGVQRGLIISINPITFKASLMNIPVEQSFWKFHIISKGI